MDNYEIIKQSMGFLSTYGKPLGIILGAGLSAYKLWFSRKKTIVSNLNERSQRAKQFMAEGGSNLHPFVMENTFAAIVGHNKLSASEITAILNQVAPTDFMKDYLDARPYVKIESIQAAPKLIIHPKRGWVRQTIKLFFVMLYAVSALVTFSILFYIAPTEAKSAEWKQLAPSLLAVPIFGGTAIFSLLEGRRVALSERLMKIWQ